MQTGVLTLGIETSNPSSWTQRCSHRPGVAISLVHPDNIEVIGVEPIDPKAPHDAGLMPAIDRLFTHHGFRPRDLRSVAVSAGPGGFTAVRIAVTTAKLIAEATGAECRAVPSARVVAARVARDGSPFCVALASKGDSAFLTRFDAQGREVDTGRLMTAADLMPEFSRLIADEFLPIELRELAAAAGIRIEPPDFDPVACIEASRDSMPIDPAALLPIYPREPEAVRKWRELHHKPTR